MDMQALTNCTFYKLGKFILYEQKLNIYVRIDRTATEQLETDLKTGKFIRFGIDLDNTLNAYNLETKLINEKLLLNHSYEIDTKNKQIENEYIRINLEHTDKLYELYKKNYNLNI